MTTESLDRLLAETESILDRLVQVQSARLMALARLEPGELERLNQEESAGTEEFAAALRRRGALLDEVNRALGPDEKPIQSLRALAARFPRREEAAFAVRLERIGLLARKLRDLAAENWLVGYRSAQHLQASIDSLTPLAKRSYDQPSDDAPEW